MMENRTILHVDMDAFFASVEQHDHPEYRGRPVIVGAAPDRRGVVSACSYEARKFGVRSAMPSVEAGRRCPEGVFVPVNMQRYADVSRQVFGIFERFSPYLEPISIDEAFVDITGSEHLFGGVRETVRQIKQAVFDETGLTCSVGVAPNKFLAKIASEMNKPNGVTYVPEQVAEFLAPLPIRSIWGVGPVLGKRLEAARIRVIRDLQQISEARLAALVGENGAGPLKRLAFGMDERPITLEYEEKSMSRETTFDTDQRDTGLVYNELLQLVDSVAGRLRNAEKYAGGVQLKMRWADFETITRQHALPHPVSDVFGLMDAARTLFLRIEIIKPVRLIGFGVYNLTDHPVRQLDLFGDTQHDAKRDQASLAVDRIRRKYGNESIRIGWTPNT